MPIASMTYDFPGVTRALGSTAAHILYVARGSAIGAIVGDIQIWDIAAALAVLERAGGQYCYLSGRPVELDRLLDGRQTPEPIIVAPPQLLAPLLEIIRLKKQIDAIPSPDSRTRSSHDQSAPQAPSARRKSSGKVTQPTAGSRRRTCKRKGPLNSANPAMARAAPQSSAG